MAILLCENGDASAWWLADGLRARGVPVDTVSSRDLGEATFWRHEISADAASITLELRDGRMLSSSTPEVIVNRLSFVPTTTLRAAAGKDFGYAVQEMFAFYLSWLHAWPARVINRPAPQGLCGNYRHPSIWRSYAYQAGLPAAPWRQSDGDVPENAWIVDRAVVTGFAIADRAVLPPRLPAAFAEGCVALAGLAGTALLGVDFALDADGRWQLVGASPLPNLIAGGEPLIDRMVALLA